MLMFRACKCCKDCWHDPEDFVESESESGASREQVGIKDGHKGAQIMQPAEPAKTPTQAAAPVPVTIPAQTAATGPVIQTAAPGPVIIPAQIAAPGPVIIPAQTAAPGQVITPTQTAAPGPVIFYSSLADGRQHGVLPPSPVSVITPTQAAAAAAARVPVITPTQGATPVVVDPPVEGEAGTDIIGVRMSVEVPAVVPGNHALTGHPPNAEPELMITADQPQAADSPAEALKEDPPGDKSLMGPLNIIFSETLSLGSDGRVVSMKRSGFVKGMQNFTALLDQLGGGMGSYIENNVKKLQNSKASASEEDYQAWMRSELPVHAAAGYKGYVDDSAWMGNLWIWWTLEFFVEMFAGVVESTSSMKVCADEAFKKTLYNHQNFFQRTAFTTAMKKLLDRNALIAKFQRDGTPDDVLLDVATFVSLGRPLCTYLGEINGQVDNLLQSEKKAKGKW